MAPATRKLRVTTIEICGLAPKGIVRLTELGAQPLGNGAKIKVPVEVAQHLILTHQSHVKVVEGDINHIVGEDFDAPAGWRYQVLDGSAPNPVDTSEKEQLKEEDAPAPKPVAAQEGKATNRSMAGRHSKKGRKQDEE